MLDTVDGEVVAPDTTVVEFVGEKIVVEAVPEVENFRAIGIKEDDKVVVFFLWLMVVGNLAEAVYDDGTAFVELAAESDIRLVSVLSVLAMLLFVNVVDITEDWRLVVFFNGLRLDFIDTLVGFISRVEKILEVVVETFW